MEAHTKSHQTKPSKKEMTVLVVDDEQDLRDVLKILIARVCTRVLVAGSAVEAMNILASESVDLVISDIRMPKIDGIEFFTQLRGTQKLIQPKFIFVTGGVELAPAQELVFNMSDGYLPKPFREDQIASTIFSLFPQL